MNFSVRLAAVGLSAIILLGSAPAVAQVEREADVLWSVVEVPGTPEAFAHAAGLNETPQPERIVLEWIRVRNLPDMGGQMRVKSVATYFETLERFRTLRALLGKDVSLAFAPPDKQRIEALLQLVGLSLVTRKGASPRVSKSDDQSSLDSRAVLLEAGLNLEGAEERLNAGEAVRFELPSFKALLPMSPKWWREVVFRYAVPLDHLFWAIVRDANASFLYYGLVATNSETRAYLAARPELISRIYRDHSVLFALWAGSFRVRQGRVDVPGGEAAKNLWEALVNEEISRPERFLEAVLSIDAGRLAHFYVLLDALDPPRQRFALGLYEGANDRSPRAWMRSLYESWYGSPEQSTVLDREAFIRPGLDPSLLLIQIAVDSSGRPLSPAWEYLWKAVFDATSIPDRPEKSLDRRPGAVNALFLIDNIFKKADVSIKARIATVLFAQRIFAASPEESAPDILVALRGFQRFRMLHLTLERIGIRSAAVHAAAARQAAALSQIGNPDTLAISLSQFQGGLALIERATLNRRLSVDDAERLVGSLISVERDRDGSYGSRVATWLERELVPALTSRHDDQAKNKIERGLLAGVSGVKLPQDGQSGQSPEPLLAWEGWKYRFAPATAQFDRIVRVRERQGGNSLDSVLSVARLAVDLSGSVPFEDMAPKIRLLEALQTELSEPHPLERLTDEKPVTVRRALAETIRELRRIKNAKQIPRAARASEDRLEPLSASLTADVLRSIVYSLSIADPDTSLFADGDVSQFHDFGLSVLNSEERERVAWSLPTLLVGQESRARVRGTLLGLDVAFVELALRRVPSDAIPASSFLSDVDRAFFGQTIAIFNPFDPRLNDVPAVTSAIKRGRERVSRLLSMPDDLDYVLGKARLGPLRRSLVERAIAFAPDSLLTLFSLVELLRVGADDAVLGVADLWGAPAVALNGCLCLALPPPVDWEILGGRSSAPGFMASGSADMLLRLAELFVELRLPPALAGDILPFATRTVFDESRLNYHDDWMSLMTVASSLSRRAVEDYVSRVTAGWSLIPVEPVN